MYESANCANGSISGKSLITGPRGSVLSISSVSWPACLCNSLSPIDKAGAIASIPVIVVCEDSDTEIGRGFAFSLVSTGFSPVSEICAVCAHAGFWTTLFPHFEVLKKQFQLFHHLILARLE